MKVKIYWNDEKVQVLFDKVNHSLEEIGLNDFIEVETTSDENLKNELNITAEPALIIEEESIDFKDTIFEGIIPEDEELKSMFISIIGGESHGGEGCGTGGCGSGCSC